MTPQEAADPGGPAGCPWGTRGKRPRDEGQEAPGPQGASGGAILGLVQQSPELLHQNWIVPAAGSLGRGSQSRRLPG